jgi:hypothetical protein
MTFEASLIVAVFIIITALTVLTAFVSKRRLQAHEDELKQGASARGWRFEKKHEHGYRVYRYSGSTDGVEWVAESARLVSGGNKGSRRRHIGRWHGKWSPGVSAPIVALGVPKGKEDMGKSVAAGDGLVARLAVQAVGFMFDKAFDVYFGKEIGDQIDAGKLKRVESASVPGFIIMAGNVDEASRVLSDGLQQALVSASNDATNVLSETDRPYVLVRPEGVSLARMEPFRNVKELEQFVQAGLNLKRAFRFGGTTFSRS